MLLEPAVPSVNGSDPKPAWPPLKDFNYNQISDTGLNSKKSTWKVLANEYLFLGSLTAVKTKYASLWSNLKNKNNEVSINSLKTPIRIKNKEFTENERAEYYRRIAERWSVAEYKANIIE